MKARKTLQRLSLCVLVLALVVLSLWLVQIFNANRIARRDFAANPCWFVPEAQPRNTPALVPGPRGFHIPNPLRQINRRFLGVGLDEPHVHAPHFAVAALDDQGHPALWAWSYRQNDFWPLSEQARSRGGDLDDFASAEIILAACPGLAPPLRPDGR